MIDRSVMKTLKSFVGRKVAVQYIEWGKPHAVVGRLKKVDDFVYVEVDKQSMPFIGCDSGIQTITDKNLKVIYDNPLIFRYYYEIAGMFSEYTVNRIRALTFGKNIVRRFFRNKS